MSKKTINEDLSYIYKKHLYKYTLKNKTIFIVGSNGFIGFYLCSYLIKYSDKLKFKKLYLADINNDNKSKKIKTNITKIKFDVNNDEIPYKDIDIFIHIASIASPIIYRKFPLYTADSNVNGIRKILDYAKSYNKKIKILYFSTSEIYGDPDKKNIPTKESYRGNVSSVGPRACYDEAKRYSETLCYIYGTYYSIPIVVIRPFNNFGPGLNINDGRLVADLAKAALKKKSLILHSDGSPTRTFCYIADAIPGYLNCLKFNKFEIINIGNDKQEISVKNFADIFSNTCKKILGYYPEISFEKSKDKMYLVDNPQRRKPNIDKARELINFKPEITLRKGVEKYLEFLKH